MEFPLLHIQKLWRETTFPSPATCVWKVGASTSLCTGCAEGQNSSLQHQALLSAQEGESPAEGQRNTNAQKREEFPFVSALSDTGLPGAERGWKHPFTSQKCCRGRFYLLVVCGRGLSLTAQRHYVMTRRCDVAPSPSPPCPDTKEMDSLRQNGEEGESSLHTQGKRAWATPC